MTKTIHSRWRQALTLENRRHARSDLAARRDLARDLQTYRSQADLMELAAMLDRHSDAEADAIRDAVDWTRAA